MSIQESIQVKSSPLLAVADNPMESLVPLTTTQRDLYLDSLKNPSGKGHQVVLYGIVNRLIDVTLWKENLAELIRENPILATRFQFHDDEIYQYVDVHHEPIFTFLDYSAKHYDASKIKSLVYSMSFPDQDLNHPLVHHYLIRINPSCHVVLFRIHHVLIDGYCGKLYVEKIANRYFQWQKGNLSKTEPDLSFFHYVSVHRKLFDKPETIAFWKKQLSTVSLIRTDHGISIDNRVVEDLLVISSDHHESVKRLCHNQGIRESNYWLGILALVYRYQFATEGDFCFRTFSGGRKVQLDGSAMTFDTTLGCFYHIFPVVFLKDWFGHSGSFTDMVNAVTSQISSLGEKRFISMKEQNALLSGETFTLYYNFQPFWEINVDGEKGYFEERYNEMGNQIEFRVAFTHDQLELHLDYNQRFFNGVNLLARIEAISQQILRNCPIHDLNFLTAAEQQVFSRINGRKDFRLPAVPYHLAWRQMTNDRIAVTSGDERFTYHQLDRMSECYASILKFKYGVRPGDLVGLMLPRSVELMAIILALWKTGAAYLPLAMDLPERRINKILDQASLKLLVSTDVAAASRSTQDWSELEWVSLSKLTDGDVLGTFTDIADDVSMLSYVIFTSGSTGVPKGACVEHRGMINHMLAKIELLQITEQDKIAFNASPSFDISVWQMFNALLCGGCTVVLPDAVVLDVEAFLAAVDHEKITILEVVPSYLELILEQPDFVDRLQSLRYMVVTGEELKSSLVNRWFDSLPAIPLVNAYGPTEASDDITHYVLTKPISADRVPVGAPVSHMNIHVINPSGQRCGFYMKGEICVSGTGVGRGYLNDQTTSEKVFVRDPWNADLRMYRTGDAGRWLPDGNLVFLGRLDNQIKFHGYRIELGEIEHAMETLPAITRSVAMLDDLREPSIHCFYVAAEVIDTAALLAHARNILPPYMVPAHFRHMASFPLTAHGKIDKKAFMLEPDSIPSESFPSLDSHPVYAVWCDVLQLKFCSPDVHFFERGGDSIKAMKLVNRIRKEHGIEVPVATLFHYPVLNDFLRNIGVNKLTNEVPLVPIVNIGNDASAYVPSMGQKRLLVTEKTSMTGSAYVMVAAYSLDGPLNVDTFAMAVRQLVIRHEILRTTFNEANGEFVQVIWPELTVTPTFVDISNDPEAEKIAHRLLHNESETPFDLSKPPLFRCCLVRLAEHRYIFIYAVHHLLTDGWSKTIIRNDLAAFYNHSAAGKPLPSPLGFQYKDFASWQRQMLTTPSYIQQGEFWRRMLSTVPPATELPLDFLRASEKSYEGATVTLHLNHARTKALTRAAAETAGTLFHLLVTSVHLLVYQYTGLKRQIIGTSASGRTQAALENQVGFYVNTLPLVNEILLTDSVEVTVRKVSQNILGAFENQDYPFLQILEDLPTLQNRQLHNLINLYVEFHNYHGGVEDFAHVKCSLIREHHVKALFDMEFNFELKGNELILHVLYNKSLYRAETASAIGDRILSILAEIPASIKQSLGALLQGQKPEDTQGTDRIGEFDLEFDF